MAGVQKMLGSKNRVLFQNSNFSINMVAAFDDPAMTFRDICFYNQLAFEIENKESDKTLVSKGKFGKSVYVELHRKGIIIIYIL